MIESTEKHLSHGSVDLQQLIRVLWGKKWIAAGIAIATTLVFVAIAMVIPNTYRAEALLAPNQQEAGGLSSVAAQYGGLASLAGIDLGGDSSGDVTLGLEILKSRKFISEFIERHGALVALIAADGWDSESGALLIDSDDFDTETNQWVRDVRPPKRQIPSMQEAYDEFTKILSVDQDKDTGFVSIAIEHFSPVVAKQWVDLLIDDLNASVMERDVGEAEQAIEYLNQQIQSTPLADMRNVFSRLVEEQIKIVLLSKVTDEYLLKTIDPAVVPELKVRPQRLFIAILGLLLGILMGICWVVGLNWSSIRQTHRHPI